MKIEVKAQHAPIIKSSDLEIGELGIVVEANCNTLVGEVVVPALLVRWHNERRLFSLTRPGTYFANEPNNCSRVRRLEPGDQVIITV